MTNLDKSVALMDGVVATSERATKQLEATIAGMDRVKVALRVAYKIAEDQMEGEYVRDVQDEITTAFDLLFDDYIYDDTQK